MQYLLDVTVSDWKDGKNRYIQISTAGGLYKTVFKHTNAAPFYATSQVNMWLAWLKLGQSNPITHNDVIHTGVIIYTQM